MRNPHTLWFTEKILLTRMYFQKQETTLATRSIECRANVRGLSNLNLFRCRSADNLHKPIRANPLCECRPHLPCCHTEIYFRSALRLVERQADLGTPDQAGGNAVCARLAQRNLPQQQGLGLL